VPILEKAWSVLNPALRKPLVDKDKILLISGRDDLFITKEDSEALCAAWGNPKRIVIPCGHSLQVVFNLSYIMNHIIGATVMFISTVVYCGLFKTIATTS